MRHPHDIVPRDDKDDLLIAIYDELCGLRGDVQALRAEPVMSELLVAEPPVRASAVPAVEATPEPAKAAAPPKPRAKRRKTTTRKKKTTT